MLHGWLGEIFGPSRMNPYASVDVSVSDNPTNEPEPDLIVLNRDESEFLRSNPRPADLLLVVEIADTPPRFDLRPGPASMRARRSRNTGYSTFQAGARLSFAIRSSSLPCDSCLWRERARRTVGGSGFRAARPRREPGIADATTSPQWNCGGTSGCSPACSSNRSCHSCIRRRAKGGTLV